MFNVLPAWWQDTFLPFLDDLVPEGEFLGNRPGRWVLAFLALLLSVLGLRIGKAVARRRALVLAERRPPESWLPGVVLVIEATRWWFLSAVGLFLASLVLVLDERAFLITWSVLALALIAQAALWANGMIHFAVTRYGRERMAHDPAAVTTAAAVAFLGRIVVWSLALLLILDNLGINVTALIAGLGIGGIAVALAAQNVLGDLFASLAIVLDKPFVLGDFIIVGDLMGTVEHIGIKTTRVRSLSGEQLIFSNSDLLTSRVRNFKRMRERRVVFSIGVTYDTPAAKVKAIPGMLREAVEAQSSIRFDRAHFKEYGDSSLVFEVVYLVLSPDYNLYMDIQQQINFHLLDRFAREGIQFAFPTRTVHAQVSLLGEGKGKGEAAAGKQLEIP